MTKVPSGRHRVQRPTPFHAIHLPMKNGPMKKWAGPMDQPTKFGNALGRALLEHQLDVGVLKTGPLDFSQGLIDRVLLVNGVD